jgi:hypothetical protein
MILKAIVELSRDLPRSDVDAYDKKDLRATLIMNIAVSKLYQGKCEEAFGLFLKVCSLSSVFFLQMSRRQKRYMINRRFGIDSRSAVSLISRQMRKKNSKF